MYRDDIRIYVYIMYSTYSCYFALLRMKNRNYFDGIQYLLHRDEGQRSSDNIYVLKFMNNSDVNFDQTILEA